VNLVLDASVVVKLAVAEDGRDEVVALMADPANTVAAPDLLLVEVANALWRKCIARQVTEAQAQAAMLHTIASFPNLVPAGELAAQALELGVQLQHPTYDCFYLACAIARSGQVVTADGRFARAARLGGFSDRLVVLGEDAP
jgi:predicted nucleic acid-binding protein